MGCTCIHSRVEGGKLQQEVNHLGRVIASEYRCVGHDKDLPRISFQELMTPFLAILWAMERVV